MTRRDTAKALITRERAAEDAWIVYQSRVNRLSSARIAELALLAAIRLADGTFDPGGGLGKRIAERTVAWRLSERREDVVHDMIQRPLMDMIAEEVEALDEEIAWWATMSRTVVMEADEETGQIVGRPNPLKARHNARTNLLRVMESKRKLLGLDQPARVDVRAEVVHTDPATTQLAAALDEAAKRREQAYTDIATEEEL